jgi:hypothetical protein
VAVTVLVSVIASYQAFGEWDSSASHNRSTIPHPYLVFIHVVQGALYQRVVLCRFGESHTGHLPEANVTQARAGLFFHILDWSHRVLDIRERFRLDLDETIAIADQ